VAYAYVADYARLRPDITAFGSTLQELAAKRGVPAGTLEETVESVNRKRAGEGSAQLSGTQWCLLGPACAYFTTTEGGAAIDREFHVLEENGAPIPGLFAVGQVGLGGQILRGHGLHIAWAMTSGRLAGMHVASHGQADSDSSPSAIF
jgi:fumarate reductase flavoprotein subunit